MKLKIKDGRGELYQWDIGRKIIVEDGPNIDYLHFADLSKDDGVSYKCEVIEENGIRVCHIPNACFANGSTKLVVYSVDVDEDGMATTTTVVFPIRKRQKPSDYTASPEIIMTAEEILKKASAKADEAESYMNTSMKYAVNPVDEVISGTDKYSSLHWASKANDIYNDVVEYVGSSSDPSSALGSIDTARQSAIIDIDSHVNTVKVDLKSYGENLVDDYINNTSKPSITDFIDKNLVPIQNNVLEIESNISDMKKSVIDSESNAQSYKNLASASATSASTSEANAFEYKKQAEIANTNAQQALSSATTAMGDSISAKDIALQTLATIQGIESNVSSMKSSVETTKGEVETLKSDVATMKASVETSEANVTQMKTSVEGTKSDVEGLKSDVTALKAQTQTIVDNAKNEVTGLLDTKVDYTDSLTYEEIMATNPVPDLTNKVASASALKESSMVVSGSYTPSIISGGVASSVSSLSYVKVGKTIHIAGNLYFTLASTTESILIFSLPDFGSAVISSFGIIGYISNPNISHYATYVYVENNAFRLYRGGSSIYGNQFSTDTQYRIEISVSYVVS